MLWTLEVNDVLKVNLEGIKKLKAFYYEPRKKFMHQKDALSLFIKDTAAAIGDKEAGFCYGMSKMTLPKETEQFTRYIHCELVELLEMIGRIADHKYAHEKSVGLHHKIEYLLDDLFPLVNFKRRPVGF